MSTRWEDRELDLRGVIEETRRLFRRASKRKALVAAVTLLLTVGIVVRESRKQRTYPARVVLSATEGEDVMNGAAHTNGKLIDYLWYAVFTDRQLLQMAKKHDYRPDLQAKNERMVLDAFRDDLDIDIYKNEFTEPRYNGEPPRSARIAISMRMPDPKEAVDMTRDLGDLVIARDAENRRERFEAQSHMARQTATMASDELSRGQRDLATAREKLESVDPSQRGPIYVEIADLERQVQRAQVEQKDADVARRKLVGMQNADKESLTLRFDRIDWGAPQVAINPWLALTQTFLLSLFGLLPVVAMGVGAFDGRVYDDGDVKRTGLVPLGVVRRMKRAV